MTCEAQGLGKLLASALGAGGGKRDGCYIKATPERAAVLGACAGGRNGLARAGMRACGACKQGKEGGSKKGLRGGGGTGLGQGILCLCRADKLGPSGKIRAKKDYSCQ